MAEELSIFNSLDNFRTESGLKSTHQLRARLCAFINFLNKSMSVKMKTYCILCLFQIAIYATISIKIIII